jgi:hypothetical protein
MPDPGASRPELSPVPLMQPATGWGKLTEAVRTNCPAA